VERGICPIANSTKDDRTVPINISAIWPLNKGYIAYSLLRMRHTTILLYLRSKIWRNRRVPRPRFLIRRENFDDSRTFKEDI